ncbi:hypothetical protein CISG_08700 [Coccidioides immitis RMSCC 3703]|uniref:Uncharacterized protein n=1 Tax=Coccidioides immitis RMSCC 3703 TaxID=454286 RepID=A0A0J8U2B9_COCIT|nr:hypothetical protein CISG_08700 [Coccidioides immitis RMSCC 3703]
MQPPQSMLWAKHDITRPGERIIGHDGRSPLPLGLAGSYRSRNRKQFKADSINPKQYSRKCAAQPGRHLPNIEAQTNGLGFWIRPDDERNCGSEGEVTSGWWIEEFGPQSLTHDRMRERYRRTRTSWMEKRREYGQREADTGANAQRQGLWPMHWQGRYSIWSNDDQVSTSYTRV